MTLRSFFCIRHRRFTSLHALAFGAQLGLALLLPACGGQSEAVSTDTGNPPVIIGQKLHVVPSGSGVVVAGDAGAVTPGASVAVENVTRGEERVTTAAQDGSFEVELAGTPQDEYRVEASLGGRTTSVPLNGSGGGDTELAGLEFLLESSEGFTPVEGTQVRLSFEASDVSFNAGCNTVSGDYSLCDGKLCVSELITTDIGCAAPLHTQDEWLADFVTSQPSVTLAGSRLTLAGTDATLEFLDREVADPDRDIYGSWTIDTLLGSDSVSSVPGLMSPTVEFRADGSLSVNDTCHTGDGTFVVSGATLTLSDMAYTEEGCNGSNEPISTHVQQVLTNGSVDFEIDAARLTIQRGALGISATIE